MKKILIVDDEEDLVTVLRERLVKNNYEVLSAKDGEEGLSKVKEHRPDLILLDIRMPKLDGFSFFGELSSDRSIAKTPVIVVSGHENFQQIFKMAGVSDYFVKPYDMQKLLETIKSKLTT